MNEEEQQKRLAEFNTQKAAIESTVALLNSQIVGLQQQLANHNRDYLILQGKIELLEEIAKEENK